MFPETILQMNNGATVSELSDALERLVAAVRSAGKSGSLTLTIKVAPASQGTTNVLMVETQVKTKLPEADRGMTVFYAYDVVRPHRYIEDALKEIRGRVANETAVPVLAGAAK